jgi:hypothetical protein
MTNQATKLYRFRASAKSNTVYSICYATSKRQAIAVLIDQGEITTKAAKSALIPYVEVAPTDAISLALNSVNHIKLIEYCAYELDIEEAYDSLD